MALGFAVLGFALAFWQRPGWATSDTKIDLHVDPSAFLSEVASVWSPSIDLGAVQGAQYSGYLWPMGPAFALLHGLGLSPWVAQRIWLGVLFAVSAWGMLRLLDAFLGRPRGVPHLIGAGFYLLNPYTVIFTGRTSLILLGYAVLPWLLLVVHNGVRGASAWRDWRAWWWAAVFALVLTSIGGGINAAVVGWMLVGPLVLLLYEPIVGSVRWRDAGAFLVRVGVLGTVVSLWWLAPLFVHARYGIDFLQFTEQPRSIWATNSAPEALRLMGYWTSYVGVGFYGASRPLFTEAGTLLFNPVVVGASLLLPALAIAGFVLARRWRYAPFFLLLLVVGAVIEVAGFPNGTPAREGMEWVYRNVPLIRFMRTTQKAAPLVATGVAGLLALSLHVLLARVAGLTRVLIPAAVGVLILLAALPLVRGTAVEKQLTWKHIPSAWTNAGHDLDRDLPRNARALILPGQIFANYTWGGTTDAILPRLTKRPVAVRYETPYSDPRATDTLWTIDRLVQQRRLLPGQLRPLLRLIGAGAVVTGSDDDISRSGGMNAAAAARELAGQGLGDPSRAYGPVRSVAPPRGELDGPARVPQVRRYDVGPGRGLVSVAPGRPTIVDGSAEGLAGLAAFGALPERAPILYAGDLDAGELRREAGAGAEVVITDSNRRRRVIPEFLHQNLGATLAAGESVGRDFATIAPFATRGSDAQTVTAVQGARYLRAPSSGGLLEFPEYGAFAAFDGDPDTVWAADRYLHPRERWIEIGFERPRDVPYVDLLPVRDWSGTVTEVDVGGVRAKLGPGITRVRVGLRHVGSLRVTITKVRQPPGNLRGSGGFREIRIPGVHVSEPLRPPVLAARALHGRDLSNTTLTWVFERTTGDTPFRRDRQTGSPLLELASNRRDPEKQLDRVVLSPAARSYELRAWVHPDVDTPDSELDRMAGMRGPLVAESSGRFHDEPRFRASSAFDGDPRTAWTGIWARPSAPYPWIEWRSDRTQSLRSLRLVPGDRRARRATAVLLEWPGGLTGRLPVGRDGTVALPHPVRARRFRLTVLSVSRAETRALAIASIEATGLTPVSVPRRGPLQARCGDARVRVAGATERLIPRGTIEELDAGRPLRARGCSGTASMGEGVQRITSLPAAMSIDQLMLRSPAPESATAPPGRGRVVDPGTLHGSSVDGARVALDAPAWLVLGESFSEGWRAKCDGRDLGVARPVNGYANGWRAPRDCRDVEFAFAPQRGVRVGYAISLVAAALLMLFLICAPLLARRREAPADVAPAPGETLPVDSPAGMSLPRAAAIALLLTVPLAVLFALRTSVAIFPLLTLILWRGVPVRTLTLVAAAALGIVVPILYAVISPRNRGGFNFEYSTELIWAHWVGVVALVALMVVCWRSLAAARGRR
jgi:arabinofuranan 3-O-arabinosyltransferase